MRGGASMYHSLGRLVKEVKMLHRPCNVFDEVALERYEISAI